MVMKNSKKKKLPSKWVAVAALLIAGLLFAEKVAGTKVRFLSSSTITLLCTSTLLLSSSGQKHHSSSTACSKKLLSNCFSNSTPADSYCNCSWGIQVLVQRRKLVMLFLMEDF
jgi:hypothetical protein